MNLGAEPKKMVVLGVLLAAGGYFFYSNVIVDSNDDRPKTPPVSSQKNQALNTVLDTASPARGVVRPTTRTKTSEEFRPSMKRKPEDAVDPMSIDPTLRLDLLARAQSQQLDTIGRNPFQFGTPPPPPIPPAPKVVPKTAAQIAADQAAKKAEPPKPTGPPKPPPLNLAWKYYGYTSPRGSTQKRAFFLDGDDIMFANEGEVLKKKYKVVRIGVNSVVVEDTDTKSQQTFPLAEEAVG